MSGSQIRPPSIRQPEPGTDDMSLTDLKEYAIRCAVEPELRARAKAIGFANPEAHIRHAESLGLEFDMEDALAFRNEMTGADEEISELSDEEMEQIAGGAVSASAVLAAAAVGGAGSTAAVGAGAAGAAGAGKTAGW